MPDPARLLDPTSDGGAITSGCDSVLIDGRPCARENDAVTTPKLGAGSIVQHARTVEVGGRLVAFTGHQCQQGGPGCAGEGLPDVLTMSSLELLKAELEDSAERIDSGEAPPEHEMSASREEPRRRVRERQETVTTDENGVTHTRSSGGADVETHSAQIGDTSVTFTDTSEGDILEVISGGNAAHQEYGRSYILFTENLNLTATSPNHPSLELVGGATLGELSYNTRTGGFNSETGEFGPDIDVQGTASLFSVFFRGRVEVSALDALNAVIDPLGAGNFASELLGTPSPQDVTRSFFPSLDDYTAEFGAKIEPQAGLSGGATGKAALDLEEQRLEVAVDGKLAIIKDVGMWLSIGKRRTGPDAIGGGRDVVVMPAPSTVSVEDK